MAAKKPAAQEVYIELLDMKDKMRTHKAFIKEMYEKEAAYVEVMDKIKVLREQRKQVVLKVNGENSDVITKIEDLTFDIKAQQQLLNDILLGDFVKGKAIELEDKYNQQMLPIFAVRLQKA